MATPIEPTKRVGYEEKPPVYLRKPAENKPNILNKFWEELEKHRFVPNTAYSPTNPAGHLPFNAGGSTGTASASN